MRKENNIYTGVVIAALMAFVLSVSVAAPLVFRSFYYAHIEALDLATQSGYTSEEIREAYDEMMDFCMKGEPFGTGVLKWSESGKDHFADCAVLFHLDFQVMLASVLILIGCLIVYRKYPICSKRFFNRGPFFWAGGLEALGFLVIAGLAALDFDRAFVIFHHLFFPGKDNWVFDPWEDEIILVLPEIFFRNCAILIVGVMFVLCAVLIGIDIALSLHRRGVNK
ncbi:MAG: TIGR01906 family membrane protein [Clostridiales bacterium]|nr:TIGR01906 family membrane protein [Clostridiales bacterium]